MREAVREVVLSYAGADRKRVAPLVHALEEDGLGIWWDQDIGGRPRYARPSIIAHGWPLPPPPVHPASS